MNKLTIVSPITPELKALLDLKNGEIAWSESKENIKGPTLEVFDPAFWGSDLQTFLSHCRDRAVRGLVPCFELSQERADALFWIDEMGHCARLEEREEEQIRDAWKQICFFDPGLGSGPTHYEFLWPKNSTESRPALFLDRDGVLIHDIGYLDHLEDIQLRDDILPLLKKAQGQRYKIIIVTNQSGVARGMFDESFVEQTHKKIDEILAAHQIHIDAWYTCPFHYYEGGSGYYCARSILRKPLAGMALKAAWEHSLASQGSVMIGDKNSDKLLGLGVETFLIRGNYEVDGAYDRFEDLICDLPF